MYIDRFISCYQTAAFHGSWQTKLSLPPHPPSAILLVSYSSISFSFFIISTVCAKLSWDLTKYVHGFKVQLKAFSFHLPCTPNLCSGLLCVLIALFKPFYWVLVTSPQCYTDKHIIPLMWIVNSLRVRTVSYFICGHPALYWRQLVNI